ncbi:MAG TPA: hypothetical protein PKD84_11670 [Propionicimonas sp.]|jgi:hypothetical protein|nr:hypothetical protein [Propionicimonas sp.]
MSTPRPEQTPPRPNPGGPLQPRPAASYADLVRGQQSGANPQDDLDGSQRTGNSYHGWKPTRSPWPGYVGLVMVIIAILITMSVMGTMMQAAVPLIVSQVRHGVDPTVSPAMVQMVLNAFEQAAPDGAMLVNIAYWLGVAGALLGLVGAIIGRGRGAGVMALVIGILAPVLVGVYVGLTLAPLIAP